MNDRNLLYEMRDACKAIGCYLRSTDRFIHDSILWLTAHGGPITIEQIEEEDGSTSWVVRSGEFHAGDESLPWALVAAVKSVESILDERKGGDA
jgi:hypothetical protein